MDYSFLPDLASFSNSLRTHRLNVEATQPQIGDRIQNDSETSNLARHRATPVGLIDLPQFTDSQICRGWTSLRILACRN